MSKIKLMLVDDHQMIRDGIRSILESDERFEIVAEAANGLQALEILALQEIDIVLMDINMPVMDGLTATLRISRDFPGVKILILSMLNENEYIREVIENGASGYILKDSGRTELISALIRVYEGDIYFSDSVKDSLIVSALKPGIKGGEKQSVALTEREIEILRLIAQEYTNNEIADKLFLSVRTVDAHRRNLLAKTNSKNTAGLVKFGFEKGIIR